MPEEYKEYNDLIKQMKAMPQVNPPSDITQKVMGRLVDDHHSSIRQLMSLAIKQAGEISLSGFVRADSRARDACFSFFITGFFFFLIGSILFCSVLFLGYEPGKSVLILIPSILILMASISLFIGGLIVAADSQASAYWAKRAIIVYGVLMILNSVLIAATVKTILSGLLSLIFAMAVIVMGMTLLKSLENQAQGSSSTFRGEMHNAL